MLNIKENGNARVEGEMTNIPHFTNTFSEIANNYSLNTEELKTLLLK